MNIVTKVRLTTSVKTNASLYKQVEDAFVLLHKNDFIQSIEIIERKKTTIKQLFKEDASPLIVFESTGPKLYLCKDNPIYFHPDTVKIKLEMHKQNKLPPLIEVINEIAQDIETIQFIDGTMGLGRDSFMVLKTIPNAVIFAIEIHPLIHFVISEGMKRFLSTEEIKRIHFINGNHFDWVEKQKEKVHFLYLDYMFENTLIEENSMGQISNHTPSLPHQVALKNYNYLILKAHFKSDIFSKFKAIQCIRKNTKTHYGLKINYDK